MSQTTIFMDYMVAKNYGKELMKAEMIKIKECLQDNYSYIKYIFQIFSAEEPVEYKGISVFAISRNAYYNFIWTCSLYKVKQTNPYLDKIFDECSAEGEPEYDDEN